MEANSSSLQWNIWSVCHADVLADQTGIHSALTGLEGCSPVEALLHAALVVRQSLFMVSCRDVAAGASLAILPHATNFTCLEHRRRDHDELTARAKMPRGSRPAAMSIQAATSVPFLPSRLCL